jgi:hypothetical protein
VLSSFISAIQNILVRTCVLFKESDAFMALLMLGITFIVVFVQVFRLWTGLEPIETKRKLKKRPLALPPDNRR